MAYETSNPPALISQRVGASGGAVYMYKDGDALATVIANGYISNAAELGIVAGDQVVHIDETNGITNTLIASAWTNGTAVGATCSAIEPIGETSIALSSAGTGTILVGDIIKFGNDNTTEYRVTTGDADVSGGGTLVITPALVAATAVGTTITVQSDVLSLKGRGMIKTLTAATTLLAADMNDSVFILNSTTEFAVTLPAPVAGLKSRFIVGGAPSGASYTIVATGDICVGAFASAADAGGSMDSEATGVDVLTFVDGQAVKGDWVDYVCDGTNWYVTGISADEDAITLS
jgi:hypothetical protein